MSPVLLRAHCYVLLICFTFSDTFLPLLLLDVCPLENEVEVGKAPNTFLAPAKCKEQPLWLLNGCFEILNKFIHVSFVLDSFGNLWNETSGVLKLLREQLGTQQVVLPGDLNKLSSIFFHIFSVENSPKLAKLKREGYTQKYWRARFPFFPNE